MSVQKIIRVKIFFGKYVHKIRGVHNEELGYLGKCLFDEDILNN